MSDQPATRSSSPALAVPPGRGLLTDPVDHWADTRPDARAVSYGDRTFTWSQWRRRLRHVAGGLQALGVRRGDRVATLDKNSLACLEVTYAAASIGAAHVVVNWRLMGDQLAYVLADGAPRVLFVGAELLPAFEAVRDQVPGIERVIVVAGPDGGPGGDEYESWVAGAVPASPSPDVEEGDTCLVLYSSGTTGFPKGVELTHRNVVAHSSALNDGFAFGPDALNLVAMPLFHVGGTCYAITGIAHGAASILLREVDPALMLAAIAQGATHVFLVPAVIGGILAAGEPAVTAFSRVRTLGYGAAPMPLPMLTAALKAWPDTRFLQVYGMTEMAGVAVVLAPEVHRDPAQAERLTAAGRPLRGVEMRVVDPVSCQDLPPRTPGEVWFRTEQIMKGYLGRPDDSAAVRAPGGWLRTGDVGYLDEDGFLFVVDRLKDMIITGGENVYSPEVESVLMAHPDIADAAVIGVPHETWGETVRAVVVPRPGAALDPDAVIAFARERLAHYKCPTSVDVVPALPRNPSGKVLKRELRRPFWEERDRQIV